MSLPLRIFLDPPPFSTLLPLPTLVPCCIDAGMALIYFPSTSSSSFQCESFLGTQSLSYSSLCLAQHLEQCWHTVGMALCKDVFWMNSLIFVNYHDSTSYFPVACIATVKLWFLSRTLSTIKCLEKVVSLRQCIDATWSLLVEGP